MADNLNITVDQKSIDNDQLPEIKNLATLGELHINLNAEILLNSLSVRKWIKWISQIAENSKAKIFLHQCSMSIIHQVNLVANFLPHSATVMSCYVRYLSEDGEEEKEILLKRGVDFESGKLNLPKLKDKGGAEMEPDVIEDKFFRFTLKK